MARSASKDPIEKFRFQVLVFTNPEIFTNFGASNIGQKADNIIDRSGFSEVTSPRATSTTIRYRENIDGQTFRKIPGLNLYEPIMLRRGVTKSRSMYEWWKLIYDASGETNKYNSIISDLGNITFQDPQFRKEVLISSMDRSGGFVKHWLLYNAYPASYRGSNDFTSNVDEKLVEELTLEYESYVEVNGDTVEEALRNAVNESNKAAEKAILMAFLNAVSGGFSSALPF